MEGCSEKRCSGGRTAETTRAQSRERHGQLREKYPRNTATCLLLLLLHLLLPLSPSLFLPFLFFLFLPSLFPQKNTVGRHGMQLICVRLISFIFRFARVSETRVPA